MKTTVSTSQTHLQVFTASRLAVALGAARQEVQKQFRGISPASWTVNSGNDSRAWSFAVLPGAIQNRLHSLAAQSGYRDGLQLSPEFCEH